MCLPEFGENGEVAGGDEASGGGEAPGGSEASGDGGDPGGGEALVGGGVFWGDEFLGAVSSIGHMYMVISQPGWIVSSHTTGRMIRPSGSRRSYRPLRT